MRIEHRMKDKNVLIKLLKRPKANNKNNLENFEKDQERKLVSKTEFSDPTKASKLKASMKSTLNAYGFNDQEVAQVYDHRIVMLVNDAAKFRNMQSSKPGLAKKISKPGKVFSSGVKNEKSDISLAKRKEKLSRLKKTGSIKDATSIFLDMINNK